MSSILVVEDDTFLSSVISQELSHAGHEVFTAFDGKQGFETAKVKKPDLILMDIMMPNMNGYEALTLLKSDESTKSIPVIVLSNVGQLEDKERARAAGAADFLVKVDYEPKEIINKIQQFLGHVAT